MGSNALEKPHAVCIPYPAQGHINPMLKLAKILHYRGFHITFVNTEYNHERLLRSRGPNSLDGLPSFRFKSIPDGLPPTDANVTQDIPALCGSIRNNFLSPFRSLLSELNSSSNSPPVTCIISDFGTTFTLDAAHELGLPVVLFQTASACALMCYLHYAHLIEKGIVPLKEASYLTNGYLDTVIDWLPGLGSIRLRDMPTFIRTTDPDDVMLSYLLYMIEQAQRASAIIINTFDALEHKVLDAFSSLLPPVYSIGPLHQQLRHIQEDDDSKRIGANLWKEEPECLDWLESKEPNSVVYVNFGSITVMTDEQLIEFAWGLANSSMTFLWVIRPDLVAGKSAVVPPEFVEETKGRSWLASWCPQEQVLNHPAIGGFLTHCGWNSMVESLCGGVPMICWPFFADQQTNCRFCCKEWGVAMQIEGDVKRNYIEDLVRKLMGGQEGKQMRKKSLEWKKLAEEAITAPNGSSFLNLNKMVNQVLLSPKN
ncbi:PREDICTED: 7-deoxyloganetin glucosyltransferase-like [Fragaria vesca subsp. vesca]|uniref:7-deoxyloganetin glucosyltransferase-like n=1 Tax=Fragaria vesca subsp. vesca TaxID=101020 RepID=UPI0002C2FBC8|nr:PREDICTED: 7-deoxyloganetin glucosyltransferase-like [Fragaria vesca subsp. vesca]XP_011465520.1 PREDICTED: 7-deoxyloganetin glucosyltransferase-like [Fragaria vesca subsp. vesca]